MLYYVANEAILQNTNLYRVLYYSCLLPSTEKVILKALWYDEKSNSTRASLDISSSQQLILFTKTSLATNFDSATFLKGSLRVIGC